MTARSDKRILQITALPFPPEIRVVKEGRSLLEAGYQMGVMCPPIPNTPERDVWQGISVFRPTSLAAMQSPVDKVLYNAAFFSPAWYRAIKEILAEYKPDVIHVHDIWLGRSVFAARTHERVVMDLHENMPAAVVEYLKGYRGAFKVFSAVFKGEARVRRYQGALLRKSAFTLVCVEEAKEQTLAAHPELAADDVVLVKNLESRHFLTGETVSARVIDDDRLSVVYVGGFGPHRGLDTLVDAAKILKDGGMRIRVYLVGAKQGSEYLRMLEQRIRDLDVSDCVTVIGWIPPQMVLTYVQQASIATVPHHSNPHTDSAIPHKLFQYMLAGKPVLVSSTPPIARPVREAGAGQIFIASDARDCAGKIRDMASDPERLKQYGAAGYKYVTEDGHNWEQESAPALVAAFDRLLGCGSGPSPGDLTRQRG